MRIISNFLHDWMRPIMGGRKLEDWEKQSFRLQTITLKNKKLARDLELACQKNDGFLTYSEYLQIEQFGTYGFHATHKHHGFTPTHMLWNEAIFKYLVDNGIHEVIELGPGNGNLAYDLYNKSAKNNFVITWNIIEVEDRFRQEIKKRFAGKKTQSFLGKVVKTPDLLEHSNSALIISSYCIDSVPPEIFVNTKASITYPNAIIGITVKDNILSELVLNENQLEKKGIKIMDGICMVNGISFDLSTWKLSPMQRAYITLKGFKLLYDVIKKVTSPNILIIDEVRTSADILRSDHFLSPLYLSIKNRYFFNPKTGYTRAGEMLYYYPIFLSSIISFLQDVGLRIIDYGPEQKLVAKLQETVWIPDSRIRYLLCYGILASGKTHKNKNVRLSFPDPRGL